MIYEPQYAMNFLFHRNLFDNCDFFANYSIIHFLNPNVKKQKQKKTLIVCYIECSKLAASNLLNPLSV